MILKQYFNSVGCYFKVDMIQKETFFIQEAVILKPRPLTS